MKNSRCQILDHEQNEYIKVCLNKSCNNRRLCFICFEENKHQQHQEFEDAQIIRITQFVNKVEKIIEGKQQLIDRQDNYLKGIKKSFDDWLRSFAQSLNQQQDILRQEIEQTNLIIYRLKNKQYHIDDVNSAIDLIQNKSYDSDDFEQYLLRIQQKLSALQDQLVIKDIKQLLQQENLENLMFQNENQQNQKYRQQLNQELAINQSLQDPSQNINNIRQKIDCETNVTCAQLSPCGSLLTYAMDKKLVIYQVLLQQFKNLSYFQNEYPILSLKFTSNSSLLYFSDQQGYIIGIQVNDNLVRFKVQTQSCQIEQLFLINDVKFITLCLQKQQIRITKYYSRNYYDDSEYESNQNSNSEDQSENEISSSHNSRRKSELSILNDQEQEFEVSSEYIQSNLIKLDHLGYLQIDFNENDDLLVYPYNNNIWIQSYNTQQNFKRLLEEYDYHQSLLLKFSQDGKQLANVQNNMLFLYEVIVNQVTLLLITKIQLTSEIYNLLYNDYCLFCDHGDLISIIKNNEIAISEDLRKPQKQQDYYFSQQSYSSLAIILRKSCIFVMNLDSLV